jgi:hypothetical protein
MARIARHPTLQTAKVLKLFLEANDLVRFILNTTDVVL